MGRAAGRNAILLMGYYFFIQAPDAVHKPADREILSAPLSACFSHLAAPFSILQEPTGSAGQGYFVARVNQEAGFAVFDNLGQRREP
jgi:hypothetical protein